MTEKKMVNMQDSMLLMIASNLQINIPSTPDWYIKEYCETHNIKELIDEQWMDCDLGWETYYRTKSALNLMHSCASYELSQHEPDPQTEH